MTLLSIALIWFVGGLAAAVIFGMTINRTNRLRDDEELPQRIGAEIGYMRPNRREHAEAAKATTADSAKKNPSRRRAVA